MTITQQHLAEQAELDRLKKENEIMREIASTDGFYEYFFKQIPKSGDIGIFSIGQGLTYDKTGFRYIENNIYSYQKRFSLGTSGFQFVNNDVYSGVWCLQNELGQDMCSNKNTHRLDYTIETGDVDYALKIIASGAYQYNSYKGLIWLQAVASSIPAILLEKGGMYMKKGDLTIEEGTIVIDNKRRWSGTFKDQTGKTVTVTKGIVTNVV